MCASKNSDSISAGPVGVGDAVGLEKSYWFVAIVNNNTEKSSAEKLDRLGYKYYLPTQTEYRVWKNGRKSQFERVVIPSILFVYCTERERKEIVTFSFINRFMTNRAGSSNSFSKPIAVIPEKQIEILKFMLGNSDTPVIITNTKYKTGDKVKVIRGNLMGLEGEVLDMSKDLSELIVSLEFLGNARLTIDTQNIEPI